MADAGLRRGSFTVLQLITRAAPVWAVLGGYAEFGMPPPALGDGGDGAAAADTSGDISLATWHAFFDKRAAVDSAPEVFHLLVSLRRIMRVRAGLMREPATLTPLLEARETAAAAASGAGMFIPHAASIGAVIDGTGDCCVA